MGCALEVSSVFACYVDSPSHMSEGGLSVGCMTLGWLCGCRGWCWFCPHPDVLISQLRVPGHLHPAPLCPLSMWGHPESPFSLFCSALEGTGTLLLPSEARLIPFQSQHCFLLGLEDVHQHQESQRLRPCASEPGRWDSTAPCDAMPASHYRGMQPIWWADFCLGVGGGI